MGATKRLPVNRASQDAIAGMECDMTMLEDVGLFLISVSIAALIAAGAYRILKGGGI
jgi:hypothetical protein